MQELMEMLAYPIAVLICFGIVAFGDVISHVTKAVVPNMAAALFLYLILIWVGMPKHFPEAAGVNMLGPVFVLFMIAHLGSTVAPRDYIKNIRIILLTIGAVIGGFAMVIGVGSIFFDVKSMVAGAVAACGGGALGALLASAKLAEIGLVELAIIPALIMSFCDLYGQPVASFCLRKYAKTLRAEDAYLIEAKLKAQKEEKTEIRLTKHGVPYGSPDNPSSRFTAKIPRELDEIPAFVLFEMVIIAVIAYALYVLTGISDILWAFMLTILACELGLLRMNLLDRSKSSGIVFVYLIAWVFDGLNAVTPKAMISGAIPTAAILLLATIGLILGAVIVGKLLGYNPWLSATIGMGCMFLCPGIMFVTENVSAANARNEEENAFFLKKLNPLMYVSSNAAYLLVLVASLSFILPALA